MHLKNKKIAQAWKMSKQAFGEHKKQIIILTSLGFLAGILEGIGINALIPLLSFAVKQESGASDFITRGIEAFFQFFHINFSLKSLLVFVSLLFIVKALVMLLFDYIKARIVANYAFKMRKDIFSKTLRAGWPHLIKQKIGHLPVTIMSESKAGATLLGTIGKIIIVFTSLVVYIVVAINISVNITLITLALGAVMFLVIKPLLFRTREYTKKMAILSRNTSHFIDEHILGFKTLKAMTAEDPILAKAHSYFDYLKSLRIKSSMVRSLIAAFMEPVSLVFICIIFAVAYLSPNFNFPAFLVIVYLVQRIFNYLQIAQNSLRKINEMAPYLKHALKVREEAALWREKDNGTLPFVFSSELSVRNLSFAYNKQDTLSDVSFSLKRGQMVGLVGPSGAGKTTLVDLLLRFLAPKQGEILLDGKPIEEISLKAWRGNIGYVSQDIFLINDTIENNIKFYNPKITDQMVERAAKMANIFDFVKELPHGFKTGVGERGLSFSAGQRQRIILARVLATSPQILVLDEATSALDNQSEVLIQQAIAGLKGKATVLIIAHRLSTVLDSDKLLVLEKGKIIERGRPSDMLKDKSSYFYQTYNIRRDMGRRED